MKATDLMVGDWANIKGKSVKVTLDDLRTMLILFEDVDFHIDPIPLTEGILVKNGFDKDERSRYYHEYILELELCDFDISWTNAGGFKYEDIRLAYVHQLQHLLRLCGIEKEIEL